jgi:hypothetical protein
MNADVAIDVGAEPLVVERKCRTCYTRGKVIVADGKWTCPNCKVVKAYQVRYGKGRHMKGRRQPVRPT